MKPVPIVEAAHSKADIGRMFLRTTAGAVFGAGLLIAQPGLIRPAIPSWEPSAGHSLVVRAGSTGQCFVDLWIGKTLLRGSLADSGADGYLTLGLNHAKQAGIDIRRLRFDHAYGSSNGRGHYAELRVVSVRIGEVFELTDLPVAVTRIDQQQAIIGIEILRLLNFRLLGDRCEFGAPA
jgi:predicted aspartyl protease